MIVHRHLPGDCIKIRMVPGGLRTGTAGIFPLRFSWQAVVTAPFPITELVQKGLRIVPRNRVYRMGGRLEAAWMMVHHGVPLRLGDQILPQIKGLADGDSVGRLFPLFRFWICVWRPLLITVVYSPIITVENSPR